MKRLTTRDWELVNAALALYEATVVDFDYLTETQQASLERRIVALRKKVFERLT